MMNLAGRLTSPWLPIPLRNQPQVPAEELCGKVVIDTVNYDPERDGNITHRATTPRQRSPPTTSTRNEQP